MTSHVSSSTTGHTQVCLRVFLNYQYQSFFLLMFDGLTPPYGDTVPEGVSHYVVWSRLPLVHTDIIPPEVWDRVQFDGLWGFVGSETRLKNDGPDAPLLKAAAKEIDTFIRNLWVESEWESAWFMNPPVRFPSLVFPIPFFFKSLIHIANGRDYRAYQGWPTFTCSRGESHQKKQQPQR